MKWTVCVILQVVRVLLENHCSPDITDNQGLTAAELAEKCSHDQCAKEIKAKVSTNHSKVLMLWGSRCMKGEILGIIGKEVLTAPEIPRIRGKLV